MIVRKVRGQNKVGKVTITSHEVEICKKLGMDVEDFIKEALKLIAKERRWKWYFEGGNK